MNVFFEESGSYKSGKIISKQGEAFQIELAGGRRAKIKGRDVLLEFNSPPAEKFIVSAKEETDQIDVDFLWEIAGNEEFSAIKLAEEYFSAVDPVKQAALILKLHSAPIHFRRRGRGRYQRAPKEQMQAGLAALEKRRQHDELKAAYEAEILAGQLPAAIKNQALQLLTKPEKTSAEFKALEAAAIALGKTPDQLMIDYGGIESVKTLLMAKFLQEYFPNGTEFSGTINQYTLQALPKSDVSAFSIDDISTTEIDDAFSVKVIDDEHLQLGIHIAAPGIAIIPNDAIDVMARNRMSTVYMPGEKITMLPNSIVQQFTLEAGDYRPAVSLYFLINKNLQTIISYETKIESVLIADNLRLNYLEDMVTEDTLSSHDIQPYPYSKELAHLWIFAQTLFEKRQEMRLASGLRREVQRQNDYNFYIEGDNVTIQARRRNSPLNTIVAEIAILANSTWGAMLAENDIPAIYRVQRSYGANRARMQTTPAPHEGLGVNQYVWITSPLRRYTDLINQWQLITLIKFGLTAKLALPFKPKEIALYAIMQSFEEIYSAYNEQQQRMEKYWCLKWLQQQKGGIGGQVVAIVIKDNYLRLEEIPLQLVVPDIPIFQRDTRLLLTITHIDELDGMLSCRFNEVIEEPSPDAIQNIN